MDEIAGVEFDSIEELSTFMEWWGYTRTEAHGHYYFKPKASERPGSVPREEGAPKRGDFE